MDHISLFFDVEAALKYEDDCIIENWKNPLLLNGNSKGINFICQGPFSKEHKTNLSKAKTGHKNKNPVSEETKQKISKSTKGKTKSELHKQNMKKPKSDTENMGHCKQAICPWCNVSGHIGAMTRWHFDNCKNKPK